RDSYRPSGGADRRGDQDRYETGHRATRAPDHYQQPGYSTYAPSRRRHLGPKSNDGPHQRQANGFNGQRRFVARPAHTRDLLTAPRRETTPEQLQGMNAYGQERFHEVDSSSDEDDDGEVDLIDLTNGSFDEIADQAANDDAESQLPRKRVKLNATVADDVPKWSNPDPYTALPPPETLGAPKKDIVEVIRKARNEAKATSSNKNEIQDNVDFISFDLDFTGDSGLERTSMAVDLVAGMVKESRTRKRKRQAHQGKLLGDIIDEWEPNETDPTPWCRSAPARHGNAGLRLHKEICDFFNYVQPKNFEEEARRDLISRVERAILTSNIAGSHGTKIHCFGSFAAGLYLPTADMDLVAISSTFQQQGLRTVGQSGTQMHRLSAHLTRSGVAAAGSVQVVLHAKVPIVKFIDKKTGIKVDISFENRTGIVANKTFQEWKVLYPAMPAIVVLIKQLLAMRGLNEVFSGGIGGFTTICLVVSMMQHMPELQSGSMDPNLHYGELLMNFLDLYGNRFDIRHVGIELSPPRYFDKQREPMPKQNGQRLTVVDPNNSQNDISGGSREIESVLDCFRQAYALLENRLEDVEEGEDHRSILECVWGGNYTSFEAQREKLGKL
ncbi:hypothetical protein BAUCODRAFT_49110, partial [Baudoinia panamericana UAMH 10762]